MQLSSKCMCECSIYCAIRFFTECVWWQFVVCNRDDISGFSRLASELIRWYFLLDM